MRSFIKKKSHQFSKKFCSYLYMPCTLSLFLKENWFFNQFSVQLIFSVVWELFSPPGSRKLSLAEGKSKEINWKCFLQSSHFQLGNHIGCFSKQLKFCRFTKSLVIFFGFTSHLCEASHRLHSDGEFHQQHQCPSRIPPTTGNIWKPNFMPMKEPQRGLFWARIGYSWRTRT